MLLVTCGLLLFDAWALTASPAALRDRTPQDESVALTCLAIGYPVYYLWKHLLGLLGICMVSLPPLPSRNHGKRAAQA